MSRWDGWWPFVAADVIFAGAGCLTVAANTAEATHTGCVVTGKDRATGKDGRSSMRVYTSCGTFAVADSLLRWQFDSADEYARLTPGATYDLTTIGVPAGAAR